MRKIPTLFKRDFEGSYGRYVLPEVTPGCEWVLAGEGVPTRKYDGTCVMLDEAGWWARREVKKGGAEPHGFVSVEYDETTGKTVGWEPIEQSGFAKYHAEAIAGEDFEPGTYELCGPKINGNPEGYAMHVLVRHEIAAAVVLGTIVDFHGLKSLLTNPDFKHEGIVWHHPDGRMAKLKVRDFLGTKK